MQTVTTQSKGFVDKKKAQKTRWDSHLLHKLLVTQKKLGNQWVNMAHILGQTESQVKNQYYSFIRKVLKEISNESVVSPTDEDDLKNYKIVCENLFKNAQEYEARNLQVKFRRPCKNSYLVKLLCIFKATTSKILSFLKNLKPKYCFKSGSVSNPQNEGSQATKIKIEMDIQSNKNTKEDDSKKIATNNFHLKNSNSLPVQNQLIYGMPFAYSYPYPYPYQYAYFPPSNGFPTPFHQPIFYSQGTNFNQILPNIMKNEINKNFQ